MWYVSSVLCEGLKRRARNLLEYISQESPIKVDNWGNDYTKCSIKRGLLDAYKRLMWNGDEGGVWNIIRHQKWRKNDVSTKSGCCSSLQHLPVLHTSRTWPCDPAPPPYFTPVHHSPNPELASLYSEYGLETHDSVSKHQRYNCCLAAHPFLDCIQQWWDH